MNTETKKTKLKWYQMRIFRFRWTGDYAGGIFEGFGLGIMMLAGAMMCDLIPQYWNTIFAVGAAILGTGACVTSYVQGRHGRNLDKKDG